jgi:hypothetical protein
MSAALGPPTAIAADELVGTLRSANVSLFSRPGGWSSVPGMSSRAPRMLTAVWAAMASRSITLAVATSPAARLAGSAVTMMSGSVNAEAARVTSWMTTPVAGTLSGIRAGA